LSLETIKNGAKPKSLTSRTIIKNIFMKKSILRIVTIVLVAAFLSSCATLFCGPVSECQRTRPAEGQPARQVRAGALILDIVLFWPGAIVDFATNAIYRPCDKK